MADTTRRMLQLLTLLQSGGRYPGRDLAARLGVSERSLRRDIERLRSYGYPVAAQPGPAGYYQLDRGTQLPPLVLADDEAVAILGALAVLSATRMPGGLGESAAGVYSRIEMFLPKRLRPQVAAWRAAIEASPEHAAVVAPEALATLAKACHERRVVRFRYAVAAGAGGRSGERTGYRSGEPSGERLVERTVERTVEPHRLVHRHLNWYLLAWDQAREDWRTFRLDRIADLTALTCTFTARELPEESASAYLAQGFTRDRTRVVVTVAAPRDDVAVALAYQHAELTPIDASTTRVELRLDDWRWLILTLAFLDADFTIEEPPEFVAAAARFAARLAHHARPLDVSVVP